MIRNLSRRSFIRNASRTAASAILAGAASNAFAATTIKDQKKIGIIGLDTSHSIAFTKALNDAGVAKFNGYTISAAYPWGSKSIKSSSDRIPEYTAQVKNFGVEIVDSVETLLQRCDVVLLETNDGHLHAAQAAQVIRAGKPLFIDKPVAASLSDVIRIYDFAENHKVPVFSASALRFVTSVQEAANGKMGKIIGANTFSPATLEPTHPDLFWYGIHGVEMLYTIMGTGCEEVSNLHTAKTDIVTGIWKNGAVGCFRGMRTGINDYGGIAYGEKGNMYLGQYQGYEALLETIIRFFDTRVAPVGMQETIEIYTFMEAADESKRQSGKRISMQEVYEANLEKARNAPAL